MKRVMIAASIALGVGCAGSTSHRPPVLQQARERATDAEAQRDRLREENKSLERRVRELEAQLGLARSRVRELKRRAERREDRSGVHGTVRIGEDSEGGSAEASRRRADGGERSHSESGRRQLPWEREGSGKGGQAARAGGSRPVLRLHGSPAKNGVDSGASSSEDVPPVPSLPSGVPDRLPVAPLPEEQEAASSSAGGAEGSSPAPEARSGGGRGAASRDPVVEAYRRALRLVRDRQFGEALGALEDFVRSHPDHPYADNATYWVGEVHYAARRYDQALQTFGRVVSEYPEGNKVADALFKMALCHKRTGDLQKAGALLERVQRQYPDTIAARMASREDTP